MNAITKILTTILISATTLLSVSFLEPEFIDTKEIIGAWGYGSPENRTVMINTDGVFSVATYNIPGKKFISSYGGTWRLEGNKLIKKIEWNSKDTTQVGEEIEVNL